MTRMKYKETHSTLIKQKYQIGFNVVGNVIQIFSKGLTRQQYSELETIFEGYTLEFYRD